VHLLRFGALKPLRLTPGRVAAPARRELPVLRFRERSAPIATPTRTPTDVAGTRITARTVNLDPRALPQNLRVVPVTAPFRPRPR
jgi:hypothetical protein